MEHRLRLEASGLRVLNFNGNHLSDDEIERQGGRFMRTPLVRRDRE